MQAQLSPDAPVALRKLAVACDSRIPSACESMATERNVLGRPPGAPPMHDPWSRPPEVWRGPAPGPPPGMEHTPPGGVMVPPPSNGVGGHSQGMHHDHRGKGKGPPQLERNDSGGATLVAERVPPSANNMDVLNEYFSGFGPVSALQVNHMRHEAILTFGRIEDAEEALRWPVLNDTSIGLRPWRTKAGQRGPHDGNFTSAASQSGAQAQSSGAPPGTGPPGVHYMPPPPHPSGAAAPARGAEQGNVVLESGKVLQTKRKREEIEDKRKALLQGLTDQLKMVLSKINDPKCTEKQREVLQTILASIKTKLTALTPKPEPEPVRQRMEPPRHKSLTSSPALQAANSPTLSPGHPGGPDARRNLRLTGLPEELQGTEARLRQALDAEGIRDIQAWSQDGASCIARFTERKHAEAAKQASKVWGFKAEYLSDEGASKALAASTSKKNAARRLQQAAVDDQDGIADLRGMLQEDDDGAGATEAAPAVQREPLPATPTASEAESCGSAPEDEELDETLLAPMIAASEKASAPVAATVVEDSQAIVVEESQVLPAAEAPAKAEAVEACSELAQPATEATS